MLRFSCSANKSHHIKRNNCKPQEVILSTNYGTITITANYIYLIKEREFIDKKLNIFKLGKTKQESNKRLVSYPKGSYLLFHMICFDCDKLEIILINAFNKLFLNKKEIGREYFEGNHNDMIDVIYKYIKTGTL